MSKSLWESRVEQRFVASVKRTAKAVREFMKDGACRKIQPNRQGKRKQGMRNPYRTRYGG